MPKTKPKPKPKAKPTAKPARRPPARAITRRHIKPKPPKKASLKMPDEPNKVPAKQEQRGARSGENAVATRSRDTTKSKGAEEGDIANGRIDPEDPERRIPIKDRRAYLLDQAEKNQAANDELNEIQEGINEKYRKIQGNGIIDPDEQRDESMETAKAALLMHDPDERKKQADATAKAEGGSKPAPKFGSPTTADFKQGQAAG